MCCNDYLHPPPPTPTILPIKQCTLTISKIISNMEDYDIWFNIHKIVLNFNILGRVNNGPILENLPTTKWCARQWCRHIYLLWRLLQTTSSPTAEVLIELTIVWRRWLTLQPKVIWFRIFLKSNIHGLGTNKNYCWWNKNTHARI